MFKRGGAPATGMSPVASRIPLWGSGEGWTTREVEGPARGRHTVGQKYVRKGGEWRAPRSAELGESERLPSGMELE